RPPIGAADGERRSAGRLERLRCLEELRPRTDVRDTRVFERGNVVPNGRLVGALDQEAVDVTADDADLRDVGRVVLRKCGLRVVDVLQRALLLEVADEPRLRDSGQ